MWLTAPTAFAATKYFVATYGSLSVGSPAVLDAVPLGVPWNWTPPPKPGGLGNVKPGSVWIVNRELVPVTPVFPSGSYEWKPLELLEL